MDDPLRRSNVWLHNPFSIQGRERGREGNGGRRKTGSSGGKTMRMKDSGVNEGKGQDE